MSKPSSQSNARTTPPNWVQLYVAWLCLVSLNTTVFGFTAPDLIFGDAVFAAESVTAFYAARNAAVLALCVCALATRSAGMLFGAVLTRFVIESFDLVSTVRFDLLDVSPALVIGAWMVVFTLPQLACLVALAPTVPTAGWTLFIEKEVVIHTDAQTIWDKVTHHEAMPTWVLLGLKSVQLKADNGHQTGAAGSLRIINFAGWGPITERFVTVEAPRRYSYSVIGGMPHMIDHLGVMSLKSTPHGTLVNWSIRFVFHPLHPLSWGAPLFVAGFSQVVGRGLIELKRQLEAE